VVKAFAREQYEIEKFEKASETFKNESLKASYAWQKIVPIIEFLAQSLSFITLLVGGILVIQDKITIGDLSMFTGLTWALALPMRNVSTILNNYQQFITSAFKVIELCEASPLIASRHDAVKAEGALSGKIEFKNVSFKYTKNGEKVLDDISFVVNPGETVAIMGPTGSGKTTMVNLMSRFYDVTEGEILLDEVNLKMRKLEDIRSSIAIATQDVFLFSDTVEDNIAYSTPLMEHEKIQMYANLAAADGFIQKMENGYETIIGERGVGISGGQKQRLALARAMAAEAPILILDDTTSAVDMETEKYIQNSLKNMPLKTTKIIIAQRISSVRHADKIMILQNGKLDIGTHDSLVRTNEYYRGICELQDVSDLPVFAGGDK
jgi:ATP-binding cassette subfamily B protein